MNEEDISQRYVYRQGYGKFPAQEETTPSMDMIKFMAIFQEYLDTKMYLSDSQREKQIGRMADAFENMTPEDKGRVESLIERTTGITYSGPIFEPSGSYAHGDQCNCPICSGVCQDDNEFYRRLGQYVGRPLSRAEIEHIVKRI